ncbi:MAG: type II CRISPR-associated endonuclease Cas1 [Phascolarctobacterium sp.]|uniref:type II CRISPR-associated endonuclease Cas1 n=1 Tax=Phascolarctobacterium sp. TaxID=2049039 RepID=UPI0026DD1FCA|nr:type II CRISPR-associated endonuclease Cas1 [Phascolarctobacterium sp.]MDO4920883.1 type II CRISPR-associated endonuclease Cas1 [Phascolarctobacterium sp.]
MSWRTVVIGTRAKLDLQLGYMVVRGERTTKIHISEISTLIIESTEVSLTCALLAELVANKIKVIFCDVKRNPCSELLPYYGSHDVSAKIKQQIAWTDKIKGEIGTAIIFNKIIMQSCLLKKLGLANAEILDVYAHQLEYRDATNREGHAAKVYFNSIFGESFTRAEDTFINSALNYGYSILLSACNREIVANGYLTQIGLIHDNIFNSFNLGSDIMEPLRPFVDLVVYRMFVEKGMEKFATEQKHELLSFLNMDVQVDEKKYVLNYAVKLYCKSVFDAINGNDVSLVKWCKFI